MKWFRHDSSANRDAKLQKLRMKYGLEGYGLYWYCIELIAEGIEESNLTFELEHDAEIIAFNTGNHPEKIQEMMMHMVKLGLFEEQQGIITCFKLAKRLDQSSTSNSHMRKLIAEMKKNPDFIMMQSGLNHDDVMTESEQDHDDITTQSDQIRLDKNRLDKNKTKKPLKTPFPIDFEVTEKMAEWFSTQNFTIGLTDATSKWQDTMLANQDKYQYTDWAAAWRNGMKRAQEWANDRHPAPSTTPPRKAMPKPGVMQ